MALNDVVKNISVDVSRVAPTPTVFAKQNENAKRQVIVKLTRDGQPFTIGTGVNGYIQGATAPNPVTKRQVKFKRDLTAIDTTQGTATFIITESMTAEIGITQCEVSIYDTEKPQEILCTANINIEVQGTGMSLNDEMASDDYQAIVNIKAEVTAMRDEVVTKTAQAIAAQSAAETAAQNAYNSALNVQKIVAGNEAYTKQETDLKYSVAPRKAQTSTTGELKLTDADYGLSYIELQGNSEQYTNTANKNLIDLHFATDGYSISSIGTLDKNEQYFVTGYIVVEPGEQYTFTRAVSIANRQGCFYDEDKVFLQPWTGDAGLSKNTVTVPENAKYLRLFDYISHKQESQLEKGNVATDYVIGAVDTPSPDYPSEVKSVGDIPKDVNGVEIRNLLDEEWIKSQPISSWQDGTNNAYGLNISKMIPKEKRKGINFETWLNDINNISAIDAQVYLSFNIVGGSNRNAVMVVGNGPTKGVAADLSIYDSMYFVIWKNTSSLSKEEIIKYYLANFRYMLSYSGVDEYRPYIGENNGLVKIESQGINVVNVKDKPAYDAGTNNINIIKWTPQEIILDQKGMGTSYAYADVNLIVGKTYSFYCRAQVVTIDGSPTNGATTIGFRKYPPSGMMYGQTVVARDGTFHDCYSKVELPGDVSLMLYVNSTSSSGGNVRLIVKDLMVVEGDRTLQEMKVLKYQPYHQQITWIPLREPLRFLATDKIYSDKLDKNGNVTVMVTTRHIKDLRVNAIRPAYGYNDDNIFTITYVGGAVGGALYDPIAGLGLYPNVDFTSSASMSNMFKALTYADGEQEGFDTSRLAANPHYISARYKYSRINMSSTNTDAEIEQAITQWTQENDPVLYLTLQPTSQFIDLYKYKIPAVYIETYEPTTNIRCMNEVKPSTMGLDYKLAISSLIKRLETLETTAVTEVNKNV